MNPIPLDEDQLAVERMVGEGCPNEVYAGFDQIDPPSASDLTRNLTDTSLGYYPAKVPEPA